MIKACEVKPGQQIKRRNGNMSNQWNEVVEVKVSESITRITIEYGRNYFFPNDKDLCVMR